MSTFNANPSPSAAGSTAASLARCLREDSAQGSARWNVMWLAPNGVRWHWRTRDAAGLASCLADLETLSWVLAQ